MKPRAAPPAFRPAASGTTDPFPAQRAALAEPASFDLNDDWDAVQFAQIESCMAAAGALGTGMFAVVAPAGAHSAPAGVPPLGAASTGDTLAVQTLALSRPADGTSAG